MAVCTIPTTSGRDWRRSSRDDICVWLDMSVWKRWRWKSPYAITDGCSNNSISSFYSSPEASHLDICVKSIDSLKIICCYFIEPCHERFLTLVPNPGNEIVRALIASNRRLCIYPFFSFCCYLWQNSCWINGTNRKIHWLSSRFCVTTLQGHSGIVVTVKWEWDQKQTPKGLRAQNMTHIKSSNDETGFKTRLSE